MSQTDVIRIAVIGAGAFGTEHARTISTLGGDVALAAIVDRDRARAEKLASDLKTRSFASLDELLAARVADAVIIATHTDTHVALAKQAIGAGLHVLVEKPVGKDVAEVEDLQRVASGAGRVAMAGHICIFHSQISALIDRVRREGFRSAHFSRLRQNKTTQHYPGYHPIGLTMVHDLYVAAQMAGGEDPATFDALDATDGSGHVDHSWATLRWRDGRVATFHAHWSLPSGAPAEGIDAAEIFGRDYHATLRTNPAALRWTIDAVTHPIGLEISTVEGRAVGMLAEELRSFAAACRTGEVPRGCRMVDAIQVQRWMDRLLESARAKRS